MNVKRYFTNLEFYPRGTELGYRTQRKRNILTAAMYVLLSAGIFAHEAVSLAPLGFRPVHASTLAAAFIAGLALLPPVVRWVNLNTEKPGILQVIAAFSIGFFLDFSSKAVIGQIWSKLVQ